MNTPFRLLLVGDSDSQLLACEALCRFTDAVPVEITINAVPREGTPESILERAASLGRLWRFEMGQLLTHPELIHFDAIGIYLTGSKISDFRLALELLPEKPRPLLFCGFNGVVLEKFMEGLSWRLGYDVMCLNGPRDREALQRITENTPFAAQTTVLTGLRRNSASETDPSQGDERPRRMLFAEQVIMPNRQDDRIRMVRILADVARRSPDWEVLIKPRIAIGETTFHKINNHISETLRQALIQPPENLRLDYRPLPELLQSSRMLGTISSTAFFDALDYGCKPFAMADFGINHSYGSHVFAGSGVWRSLEHVDDLDTFEASLPEPDDGWLNWMGYATKFKPDDLIAALLDRMERPLEAQGLPAGHITNSNLSFVQLRRGAERAIKSGNMSEAESLLQLSSYWRPTHRNVARRLWAVRMAKRLGNRSPFLKRLLLKHTYRDVR